MESTTTQEVPQEQTQTAPSFEDRLTASLLGEQLPATTNAEQQANTETITATPAPEQTEILDPNVYLKNKWGWETEEAADTEIKSLREKASKVFEYKNEESKKVAEYINENKLDELYTFLDNKKKVEKLSTADLTANKELAADLVKFGIQNDSPTLTADEVEFLFNEKYGIPQKPVEDELDDNYADTLKQWEEKVNNIQKRLVIEAKMNQPKLAQLKSELILPEIQRENQQQKPTQEDLDAFNKLKESLLQSVDSTVNGFTGFTAQVKDKDVDYPVNYTPSQEEKSLVSSKLKEFAEAGLDANAVFADRWMNKDKTLNVAQMTEDLSRIYMGKNADTKLANDAANKRLETYLREKKQINVNENNQNGNLHLEARTEQEKMIEALLAI